MSGEVEKVGLIRNELEIPIDAPIEAVWKCMTDDIDSWWDDNFYFTKEPRSIRLEPRLGGQFSESSADGSGLVWGTVVAIQPGQSITLAGPFCPPYAGPAYATLHWALEAKDSEHTLFRLSQAVFGHIGEDLKSSMAEGWKLLFEGGLKKFVENP